MTDLESVGNTGMHALNELPTHDPRTIAVLGPARGGTSMIAGALHHLGVRMGNRIAPTTFEDHRLSSALESGQIDLVRRIVARRNRQSEVWGWKRPSAFRYLDVVAREFRNPYYVVVFRDSLAVATRRHLTAGRPVAKELKNVMRVQGILVDFCAKTTAPTLLVSYEKFILRPEEAATTLARFVGVDVTDEAVGFIQPEPPHYLERASQTRSRLQAEKGTKWDGNGTPQRD